MNNFEEQILSDIRNMNFNEKEVYLRQHEKDFGFEEGELDYLLFETDGKPLPVDSIKENVKSDIKINKWVELKVIQGFYEGKWEDLTFYDTRDEKEMADFKENFKSYRENEKTSFRSIYRKVINPEWFDKEYPNLILEGNRYYHEISNFNINSDSKLNDCIENLKNLRDFYNKKEKEL